MPNSATWDRIGAVSGIAFAVLVVISIQASVGTSDTTTEPGDIAGIIAIDYNQRAEELRFGAFGLSSRPRTIDPDRRATIKADFELASKAAKSSLAWAKGRFGAALTGVTVAERAVAAPSAAQAEKFESGERLVYAFVGADRHSLWRDATGRITVLHI